MQIKAKEFVEAFGLPIDTLEKYQKSHKSALNGITGFWKKLIYGGLIGAILIAIFFRWDILGRGDLLWDYQKGFWSSAVDRYPGQIR